MNVDQLKTKMSYYQQNRQRALDYQKQRYYKTSKNKTMSKVSTKHIYNRYESVIVNSCIKKHKVYTPPILQPTDYVDMVQDYSHIPFTNKLFSKMLEYVSKPKTQKQILPPQIQLHQLCRMCNIINLLYKFGDHTDNTICNNCCWDTYELIDALTIDIVDRIIDNMSIIDYILIPTTQIDLPNIELIKTQKKKLSNQKYQQRNKTTISMKRHMTTQKNRIVAMYSKYHISIYKNPYCSGVGC